MAQNIINIIITGEITIKLGYISKSYRNDFNMTRNYGHHDSRNVEKLTLNKNIKIFLYFYIHLLLSTAVIPNHLPKRLH